MSQERAKRRYSHAGTFADMTSEGDEPLILRMMGKELRVLRPDGVCIAYVEHPNALRGLARAITRTLEESDA